MAVHAIIVTYNPDVGIVAANVGKLLNDVNVQKIHIIDNTPDGANLSSLAHENIDIHYLYKNVGIATAQNIGIQSAIDDGADYVVLFDQDSELSSGLVSGLLESMVIARRRGLNLACIGPRPLDVFSGKKFKPRIEKEFTDADGITICRQIIASGKLIDIAVLKKIGFMEDELFIDAVDHEWCWRANSNGYSVAISENVIMTHVLGDARGAFLGFKYKIGAPIRLYYQFRNILVLSRRNYVPLYWKVRCIFGIFARLMIFSFFHQDSNLRRMYMIHGIRDGILNRLGVYGS